MVTAKVYDACNEGSGRNMFTTYCVATETTMVRRRYSDFLWLYGRLMTELPGAIVPVIPHKRALKNSTKFNDIFIEERRANLETFLKAVVQHSELSHAPSMTPFMTFGLGERFDTAKRRLEQSRPSVLHIEAEEASDVASSGGTKKGLSNFLAKAKTMGRMGISGSANLLHTPEEKQVEAIRKFVTELEAHVKQLTIASSALLQVTKDTASAVSLLKQPMQGWKELHGKSIADGDNTLHMISALVDFSTDYATLMEYKQQEETKKFLEQMTQLSLDVKAFSNALKQRKQFQITYTTRFQQGIDKDAAIEKALRQYKPPEITDKLKFEREVLTKQQDAAKQSLDECSSRVIREAHRAEPLLGDSLQRCFYEYAKIQVAYHDRIHTAWSQLLPYVNKKEEENNTSAGENEIKPPMPPSDPPPPPPPEDDVE